LTWLLKSGSGHIGQIIFAWAKGYDLSKTIILTLVCAILRTFFSDGVYNCRTSLDYDCKKWRLFADGLNDIATFIDLISPLFPTRSVVIVLCSASVARALVSSNALNDMTKLEVAG
jgi:hypothetical protein